ncbi:hypothetical protein VNI00_003787 [Paramarasmius palmivorus]|uniref:F-box domain-containing protein n=1 Tax=Paramarasmius palmivorus TaxID=297713 RepID=A0AAW0DMP5_9AGAR
MVKRSKPARKGSPLLELCPELIHIILGSLSPRDIASLTSSCRTLRRYVGKDVFSIDRTLAPYFSPQEIVDFRLIQAQTGAVLSGLPVMGFFCNERYPKAVLSIYVERGLRVEHEMAVIRFLQEIGYDFRDPEQMERLDKEISGEEFDDDGRAEQLRELEASGLYHPRDPLEEAMEEAWADMDGDRHDHSFCDDCSITPIGATFGFARGTQRIQVIVCRESVMDVVLNFNSTASMNIISSSHAYCMYPAATLDHRLTLVINRESTNPESALEHEDILNVIDRDWTFIDQKDEDGISRGGFYANRVRRLGDSLCWTMKLESVRPRSPRPFALDEQCFPYVVLESNSWTLSKHGVIDPEFLTKMERYCEEEGLNFEETLPDLDPDHGEVRFTTDGQEFWKTVLMMESGYYRTVYCNSNFGTMLEFRYCISLEFEVDHDNLFSTVEGSFPCVMETPQQQHVIRRATNAKVYKFLDALPKSNDMRLRAIVQEYFDQYVK